MEAQLSDQEDAYENQLAMMRTEFQQVSRQRIHRLVQEKICLPPCTQPESAEHVLLPQDTIAAPCLALVSIRACSPCHSGQTQRKRRLSETA